jgi:hypothetical protein
MSSAAFKLVIIEALKTYETEKLETLLPQYEEIAQNTMEIVEGIKAELKTRREGSS